MQKQTQKFHGIPAMGIKGRAGNKGKKGQSIYIGFINDFFDYITTKVDLLIYYTQRKESGTKLTDRDQKYLKWLNDMPRTRHNGIGQPTGVYYTGEFMTDGKNYYDNINNLDSLPTDKILEYKDKIKLPGQAINDPETGDLIDQYDYIPLNDISYTDENNITYQYNSLYEMKEIRDQENPDLISGYMPKYKIKIDATHVTYDYADLKWAAEWLLLHKNEDGTDNEDFIHNFYAHTKVIYEKNNRNNPAYIVDDNEIKFKNEEEWHQPRNIKEAIKEFKLYSEKNGKKYWGDVDKFEIIDKYDNNAYYFATDSNNYFTDLIYLDQADGKNVLNVYAYNQGGNAIKNIFKDVSEELDYVSGNIVFKYLTPEDVTNTFEDIEDPSIELLNMIFYFKQPFKRKPAYTFVDKDTIYTTEEYMDEFKYAYTGIHPGTLFKKIQRLNSNTVNTTFNDFSEVYKGIRLGTENDIFEEEDSILFMPDEFKKVYDDYKIVLTSKNSLMPFDPNNPETTYVSWTSGKDKDVKIPTTLSTDINEGDIIYFHLDDIEDYFDVKDNPPRIQYMAVITKDMLGCTIDELISKSQVVKPFDYSVMHENPENNRAVIDNTVTVTSLLNGSADNGFANFQIKSLENILSKNDNSGLHLISVDNSRNKNSECKILSLQAISDNVGEKDIKQASKFNIHETNNSALLQIKSNDNKNIACYEQFAVNETNVKCNYELLNIVYDKYINFVDGNFVYDYMDAGSIQTQHECEGANKEAVINNLIYTINRSDFFNDLADDDIMQDYYIGYNIIYNGKVIAQEEVCADTLDIIWNPLQVMSSDILENHVEQSVDIDGNELPYVLNKEDLKYINSSLEKYKEYTEKLTQLKAEGGTNQDAKQTQKNIEDAINEITEANSNIAKYEYLPYDIIFTCRKENGFRYYSNPTQVSVLINQTDISDITGVANNYRYDMGSYYVNVIYPDSLEADLSDASENEIIKCDYDGITVDGGNEIPFSISAMSGYKISKIMFNNRVSFDEAEYIKNKEDSTKTVKRDITISNSWITITPDALPEQLEDPILEAHEETTEETPSDEPKPIDINPDEIISDYNVFRTYKLNVKDNIPEIKIAGNDTIKTTNMQDYMSLLSDTSETEENSQLFQLIDSKRKAVSTPKRTILVQVYYTVDGDDTVMHENFYITQPGFKDPRTLPVINLNLHNGLDELEEINKTEKGVLVNQFRTYLDIDISKFSSEDWGSYGSDDVTMDLVLKNYSYDNQHIVQYKVEQPYKRPTVKFYFQDDYLIAKDLVIKDSLAASDIKQVAVNNRAILNKMAELQATKEIIPAYTSIVENGQNNIANINLYRTCGKFENKWVKQIQLEKNPLIEYELVKNPVTQELEKKESADFWINNFYALNVYKDSGYDSAELSIDETIICTTKKDAPLLSDKAVYINKENNKKYIFINNEVINANSQQAHEFAGMLHDMTININNITIADAESGTLRLAVDFEMGNPVPAQVDLQFYVHSMKINVKHHDEENTVTTFSLNSYQPKSLLNKAVIGENSLDNGVREYRYSSNTLKITCNAISMTAAPVSEETDNTLQIVGLVKMKGSEMPLKLYTGWYNKALYSSSPVLNKNLTKFRHYMQFNTKWNQFNLKSSYFQDNVQNINITPIHPSTFSEDIMGKELAYSLLSETMLEKPEYQELNNTYLNVMCDAENHFNPKNREDIETFIYNEQDFLAEQYNQVKNNCPAFISATGNIPVRSEQEFNSIDVWNFEYKAYGHDSKNTQVFPGKNNPYGNGYMFLPEDIDSGQYSDSSESIIEESVDYDNPDVEYTYEEVSASTYEDDTDDILGLKELKESQNKSCVNKSSLNNMQHVMVSPNFPEYLYRSFVYDLAWEYPWKSDTQIKHMPLVSAFDFMLYYIYKKTNEATIGEKEYELSNRYRNHLSALTEYAYGDKIDSDADLYDPITSRELNIMPYTYCYNVQPRIAYNYEKDTYNVMMLRRPTIGYDTDDIIGIENYMVQQSYLPRDNEEILQHHQITPYSASELENTESAEDYYIFEE